MAIAGGQAVAGYTTTPTATEAAVVVGHAGRTILNGFNMEELVTSNAIRLAQTQIESLLSRPAVIAAQPQDQAVAMLGGTATFGVTAVGLSPGYQWRKDGNDISGATSNVYSIANVQSNDFGGYSVVVSNPFGMVTSKVAILGFAVVPVFVQQPLGQSVVAGGSVTFSAQITGSPASFSYEWRKGSTPIVTNTSAERVAFFTLNGVQPAAAGLYRVIVRNAARTNGVASANANLTVLSDANADGLPDAWEATYPTAADPAMDTDNDGLTNLEEYRAGTNPTNAASVLRITQFTAGSSAALEFEAVSNKTYTVQHADRLPDGSWSKLADFVGRATNRTETATDSGTGTNRFYRLVTPRQP